MESASRKPPNRPHDSSLGKQIGIRDLSAGANKRHLEWLLEGLAPWNNRRKITTFTPNLSGLDIYGEFDSRGALKNGRIPLDRFNLNGAILTNANLSRADLWNADLRNTNLGEANLSGAHLGRAHLEEAIALKANLSDADLTDAYLTDTDLRRATLAGALLANSQPWTAHLYSENEDSKEQGLESSSSSPSKQEPNQSIESIANLLDECRQMARGEEGISQLYFRGEESVFPMLAPSVARGGVRAEGEAMVDLMSREPAAFTGMSSTLEQWVLAQHYELPTRLLDITRNPLVALLNACKGSPEVNGRLYMFIVPKHLIKPFNSDSISVITNFAKLSRIEQHLLLGRGSSDTTEPIAEINRYPEVMRKLLHLIREEKPYFENRIDPRDFFRVFVVEPQRTFERLRAQSGAFLVSAFHDRFEPHEIQEWNVGIPVYECVAFTIPGGCKGSINSDLRLLNISREALYPGLDEAAKAVRAERYPESANG